MIILTVCIVLLTILTLGNLYIHLDTQYPQLLLLQHLYSYISFYQLWDVVCFQDAGPQTSYYIQLFRSYINTGRNFGLIIKSRNFQIYCYCYIKLVCPLLMHLLNILLVGTVLLGTFGAMLLVIKDITDMIKVAFGNEDIHVNAFGRFMGITMWICSSMLVGIDISRYSRLLIIFGCIYGLTELYKKLSITTRQISQNIGEQFLETKPSNNNNNNE